MIEFHYETAFALNNKTLYSDWITRVLSSEKAFLSQIDYIFCDDSYLLAINQQHLKHDTYTDIITFDYTEGKQIGGDIFISVERVGDNATQFNVPFEEELLRVMSHGLLHLLGYGDKTKQDVIVMRAKEEEKIKLFHVEQ